MNATVRWTLIIIGFLLSNALAMGFLILASSTSRAQVIPDYYARSTRYDAELDAAARSRALGWQVAVSIVDGAITATVRDRNGAPLETVDVRAIATPRADATRLVDVRLVAAGGGRHAAQLVTGPGLHDVIVIVERGSERFSAHALVEAR